MLSAVIYSKRDYPAVPLAWQLVHQRFVHPGPLVLRTGLLNILTPTVDRDRTVSRRSEPSSRTALMGEQPNPWDLLQPQDAMSRHRGAKPYRRYGLSGRISLLSPGELLSVERRPFHSESPDHYVLLSHLLDPSVLQSSSLMPLHSMVDFHPTWENLWTPPLLFRRRPPQSNCPPSTVSVATNHRLEFQHWMVGIPPMTPIQLAPYHLSLPTILYMQCQNPIPSYSKAPWGLSVLL